jgi:hypothetical protein
MAKKSRRARTQSRVTGSSPRPEARQSQPAAATIRNAERQPIKTAVSMAQQPVNYEYVKSDLIRIGIIAGALIVVIIMLTFLPALK